MPRFFISPDAVTEKDGKLSAVITGDDAHHISRSLRMRVGEELTLCDGCGKDYVCTISEISDSAVLLAVDDVSISKAEPPYSVNVFQSLVKGDKFDTVIQKSVECGATHITPLVTSRCTVKLSGADIEKKRVRWQRIATEAAKQCGRGVIPTVDTPANFADMCKICASYDLVLFCYENGTYLLKDALAEATGEVKSIAVIIGPEGGFSESEAALAKDSGAVTVSLGRRILRTESAAPFVLACLSFALES